MPFQQWLGTTQSRTKCMEAGIYQFQTHKLPTTENLSLSQVLVNVLDDVLTWGTSWRSSNRYDRRAELCIVGG